MVLQETRGSWEQGPEVGTELDPAGGEHHQAVAGRGKGEGRRTFNRRRSGFHGVRDQRGFQERGERKGRVVYQSYSNPPCQLKLAFNDHGFELSVLEPRRGQNARNAGQEQPAPAGERAGEPVCGPVVARSFGGSFGRDRRNGQAPELGGRQFSSRNAPRGADAGDQLQEDGLGMRPAGGRYRGRRTFNSGGRQRFLEGRPQGHSSHFR